MLTDIPVHMDFHKEVTNQITYYIVFVLQVMTNVLPPSYFTMMRFMWLKAKIGWCSTEIQILTLQSCLISNALLFQFKVAPCSYLIKVSWVMCVKSVVQFDLYQASQVLSRYSSFLLQ